MPTRFDPPSRDFDDAPFDLGFIDVGDERPTHGLSDDRRGATMLACVVVAGAAALALAVAWVRGEPRQDELPAHTTPPADRISAVEPVDDAPPVPLEEPVARELLTSAEVLATGAAAPADAPRPADPEPPLPEPEAASPSPQEAPAVPEEGTPDTTEAAADQPFAHLPSIDVGAISQVAGAERLREAEEARGTQDQDAVEALAQEPVPAADGEPREPVDDVAPDDGSAFALDGASSDEHRV